MNDFYYKYKTMKSKYLRLRKQLGGRVPGLTEVTDEKMIGI
jgi:hypothetical protein